MLFGRIGLVHVNRRAGDGCSITGSAKNPDSRAQSVSDQGRASISAGTHPALCDTCFHHHTVTRLPEDSNPSSAAPRGRSHCEEVFAAMERFATRRNFSSITFHKPFPDMILRHINSGVRNVTPAPRLELLALPDRLSGSACDRRMGILARPYFNDQKNGRARMPILRHTFSLFTLSHRPEWLNDLNRLRNHLNPLQENGLLHRIQPDLGIGLIVLFRRPNCEDWAGGLAEDAFRDAAQHHMS